MTLEGTSSILVRYGGEEFLILMPHIEVKSAIRIADTIRTNVESLKIPHIKSLNKVVIISLGVATVVPDSKFLSDDLIAFSDKAIYDAKRDGRNKVRVYSKIT